MRDATDSRLSSGSCLAAGVARRGRPAPPTAGTCVLRPRSGRASLLPHDRVPAQGPGGASARRPAKPGAAMTDRSREVRVRRHRAPRRWAVGRWRSVGALAGAVAVMPVVTLAAPAGAAVQRAIVEPSPVPCPAPQPAPTRPPRPTVPPGDPWLRAVGGPAMATSGSGVPAGAAAPPAVTASSWMVADLGSGAVLGGCAPHDYNIPASVQKLLLVATVLPDLDPRQVVTVTREDLKFEPGSSAVGLLAGG